MIPKILDLDDAALFEVVDRDRSKLHGRETDPLARYPQRWPIGLPHYDLHLERLLKQGLPAPDDVYLAGNYVRGIGLPLLLENGFHVAERVRQSLR